MSSINKLLKIYFIGCLCAGFGFQSVASAKQVHQEKNVHHNDHSGHHQHAHQHGHVELNIAFEGTSGKIEMNAPSDTVFGFEYAPKTDAQKKLVLEKTTEIENKISSMISFSEGLGCQISKEKSERSQEGKNHSDMNFSFKVQCQKSIIGTKIQFNLQKVLPKAKDVNLQLIVDSIQKSAELNKDGVVVEVK